jgi:hypothetical protein
MEMGEKEYDFTLILSGLADLTTEVENALFEAGCDDAGLGMRDGRAYLTFNRKAPALKDAILSAIRDVRKSGIGAEVLRLDVCDLVTQSDIARRTNRPRQVIHQYIKGTRGPGNFPAPACQITDDESGSLWLWCETADWLWRNSIISEEEVEAARLIAMVNDMLDFARQKRISPEVAEEVVQTLCGD